MSVSCPLSDTTRVRVVAMHLDLLEADFELLDAQERARAVRFATPPLQRRFIAAHAGMRRVLGRALQCDPREIAITHDALGKPQLADTCELHFSLSHCGGQALLALADVPVGVDIEALIQRDTDVLARQILAPAELVHWLRLPLAHRVEALTESWTRKEAALKACGLGLRLDPASFEAPEGAVDLGPGRRFHLSTIQAAPGHCAALAQTLPARPVRGLRLAPDGQLQPIADLTGHAA